MEYKKSMIIIILAIFLFSIASVCASDANDTVVASEDNLEIDQTTDEVTGMGEDANLGSPVENEILTADEKTFALLNMTINSNTDNDIYLDGNYRYSSEDTSFKNGIEISRDVNIYGNGSTIDGSNEARIFKINGEHNVVFYNITFINGNASGEANGGAIDGNSKVINCTFINNHAFRGAALYGGEAYNCNFTDNHAGQDGGAVFYSNAYDCIFKGNTARYGGAFYLNEAYNCSFINNTATEQGGAVFRGKVYNCNFTDNQAVQDGGAVYEGEVRNCNFINNTAQNGGAICFGNTGNVENCNFIDNHAKEWGGAVFIHDKGSVTNSNFTNNNATKCGGAIRIFSGSVTNSNFVNNTATNNDGGAIIMQSGSVTNCSFTNNTAANYGGAVCSIENCEVTDCSFANNAATNNGGGAVYFTETGTVTNCNFNDNKATGSTGYGGAVYFSAKGTVTNCNFVNNTATKYGGAIRFKTTGTLSNCNFTGNNATYGSAIYFDSGSATKTVSNSLFLNNRANAEGLQVTKNENNITITFTGKDNLLNAIYSKGGVKFTNVAYWGEKGVTNTGSSSIKPIRSDRSAGQNITVGVVINGKVVLNQVNVTDNEGMIVLDISVGENYYIGARHDTDSYYTEVQNMDTNMKFYANVTSQTTHNKTVNITAKSNILSEVMYGKLLFILPNSTKINATYAGNGAWWAVHTFDDYADYQVNATYEGLDNVTITNATISIIKTPTNITVENTTVNLFVLDSFATGAALTPAEAGNLTYTSSNSSVAKVEDGKIIAVGEGTANITVSFAGSDDYAAAENKTINVNVVKYDSKVTISPINDTVYPNNVTIKYSVENKTNVTVTIGGVSGDRIIITNDTITVVGLDAGKYTITIINNESELYYKSSDSKSFTVNKLATSISTADVSTTYNINKDLVVTLKDSAGKALSGVNVAVDLNGAKTYTTDKNGQVKVTTKGLAPKTYTAKITFNGNTNYDKSSKNVKVTVKKATPKLTAKKKTYKTTTKTKKYTIVLKDNVGKAIKKAKVTLKVKGKTYKAKTNSKGKATFKIKNLKKKGTFKAVIKYKGNKYYKKLTKKVKIKVIVKFKTVSRGSKDKAIVKEIQQALKDNGYYLTYQGHYLKIDGKFSSCTVRSIKEFQHDKGLKVTGKVDEKTAIKLGILK